MAHDTVYTVLLILIVVSWCEGVPAGGLARVWLSSFPSDFSSFPIFKLLSSIKFILIKLIGQ